MCSGAGAEDAALSVRGGTTIINGNASGLARCGDFLYVVLNESTRPLLVYDISEPAKPQLRHLLPAPGWPMRCRVFGRWLWTVHGNGEGFFDVSEAENPRFIGGPDTAAADGPPLRRLERGKDFRVHPNFTYATCATENVLFYGHSERNDKGEVVRRDVRVCDIADPLNPRLLKSLEDAGEPVHLEGDLLFVAKGGLAVYDVGTPAEPKLLGRLEAAAFEPLAKQGFGFGSGVAYDAGARRLFVATRRAGTDFMGVVPGPFEGAQSGIAVFDVASFAQPRLLGWTAIERELTGLTALAFHKGHVFGSDPSFGLRVFDVRNPSAPKLVVSDRQGGECSAAAILPKSGLLCVGQNITGGVVVVDVSSPEEPQALSYIHCAPARVWGRMATYQDRYLYFQGDFSRPRPGFSALFAVDLAEPRNPKVVVFPGATGRAYGALVVDRYLYLCNGDIFDLREPMRPQKLATRLPAGEGFAQMEFREPHLFLATMGGKLTAVDLTDREKPRLVSELPLGGQSHRLITTALVGRHLFLGWLEERRSGKVVAVDVAAPDKMRIAGEWSLGKDLNMAQAIRYAHVWSDNSRLFIGCYHRKLAAYDVAEEGGTLKLRELAVVDGLPSAWLMTGADGWLYRICLDGVKVIKAAFPK